MKVLIVDDESLARQRLSRMVDAMPEVEQVVECRDGKEAITALTSDPYDLVLLDIRMRGVDGFDVLEEVGPERMPPVIFVTAYDEFAVRAFEVHAMDYLQKPVSVDRLREAVERVFEAPEPRESNLANLIRELSATADRPVTPWLMIREPGKAQVLRTSEIEMFEAAGNYVYVHHGDERVLHRESLTSLEGRLDSRRFVRIHRSTIINLASVKSIEPIAAGDYEVHLHSGKTTRMSRTYRQSFMDLVDAA